MAASDLLFVRGGEKLSCLGLFVDTVIWIGTSCFLVEDYKEQNIKMRITTT